MPYWMQLIWAGLALSFVPVPSAFAQDTSVEAIVESLVPKNNAPTTKTLRGIRIDGRKTENADINLYINFEYDSDQLQQDALITLDRLAAAMNDPRLQQFDFLIAGHTDAVGSDVYNQALSERRAASVKRYLAERHGIAEARLVERGFGEQRLLDPSLPEDGVNRRVQIVTLKVLGQ